MRVITFWNTSKLFSTRIRTLPESLFKHHVRSICQTNIMAASLSDKLKGVPEVDIDYGKFKYILIKVHAGDDTKYVVRGNKRGEYHSDIYEEVVSPLETALGLDCECVGGGRILHNVDEKNIKVYGYSQGFGKANHSVTVDILKRRYPDYHSITWSDEGY